MSEEDNIDDGERRPHPTVDPETGRWDGPYIPVTAPILDGQHRLEEWLSDKPPVAIAYPVNDGGVVVQLVKGGQAGGHRWRGLSAPQLVGDACLVCARSDGNLVRVGWIGERPAMVHSFHMENYRHGETLT